MRTSRKIVVSLVGLLILSLAPLWAQTDQGGQQPGATAPGQGYGQRMGRQGQRGARMDRLAKELNLTQEQRDKLQPILQQQMQRMRALRQDTSLTPEQRQQKMQELRKSTHDQVMGILTPEQQQKWKQMRENWRGRGMRHGRGMGQGRMGPGGGMGPGGMMASRLNLTPEQQAKLKTILADARSKMQALRQSTHDQINSILTPEQQQKWEQMRNRRGRQMGPPPSGF